MRLDCKGQEVVVESDVLHQAFTEEDSAYQSTVVDHVKAVMRDKYRAAKSPEFPRRLPKFMN